MVDALERAGYGSRPQQGDQARQATDEQPEQPRQWRVVPGAFGAGPVAQAFKRV